MTAIHHIALYTADIEGAKAFFQKYFHAMSNSLYHNPRTGLCTYFLTFPDGGKLEIMNRPETTRITHADYACGLHHVAFSLGSREEVDRLTERLSSDGYEVLSGPRTTGDGYYESCVRACENIVIELTV